MPDWEDTRTAVENALSDALHASDEMVTRWVTCIETVGTDGERGLFLLSSADAKAWDTIGMLGYALQCEQASTVVDRLHN